MDISECLVKRPTRQSPRTRTVKCKQRNRSTKVIQLVGVIAIPQQRARRHCVWVWLDRCFLHPRRSAACPDSKPASPPPKKKKKKITTTKIVGTRRSLLIFLKVILRDEDHFKQWLSARCHFRFERSNSNYTYTLGESLLRPAHPVQTSCHSLNPAIAEDLPPFCHKLLYFSSIFAKNIFDNF